MNLTDINGVGLEVVHIPGAKDRAPIVFLHEGLGSVAMWRDWPARLCNSTGRAGVVYSRRGYGQSQSIPDVRGAGRLEPDYMHREALEVLPALLARLGLSKPVLLGHSDGGTIALLHAARHEVAACVVMAPHVTVEEVSISSIARAREAWEGGDLRERLSRYHADVDCAFWQWNDVWLGPAFRGYDIRDEVARISSPLLAIQGVDDAYGTLAQIDEIAQRVQKAATLKIGGCGHSPHRDRPQVLDPVIAGFLADKA
ncbi:MAG: alpha/beta hydrolase [Burkholderiaceae bacterium]